MGLKPRAGKDVELWFNNKRHPQEALMRKVRDAILAADPRIRECVKWSSPTFTFEGNIVSINPQAKQFVSLMFHTGGKIPGSFPQLTGTGATCKYMRFDDAADFAKRKGELVDVVRAWCAWKSS
jgi:hypothetical protein